MNPHQTADKAADTFHSFFGSKDRHPVETLTADIAEGWQTYEKGMDWDPNYLESMGTLDMDTEEYEAVLEAAKRLEMLLEDSDEVEAARRARSFLDAFHAYGTHHWDVSETVHETDARAVSAALGVPFAGRHGGGSSNNPC